MSRLFGDLFWFAVNGRVDKAIENINALPEEKQIKILCEPKLVWWLARKGGAAALVNLVENKQVGAQKKILAAPWAREGLIECGQETKVLKLEASWKSVRSDPKPLFQTNRKKPSLP
ncbi:MAG: hypothetical protein WC464_07075 [Bdellovibrionales bacterium]